MRRTSHAPSWWDLRGVELQLVLFRELRVPFAGVRGYAESDNAIALEHFRSSLNTASLRGAAWREVLGGEVFGGELTRD